MSVKWDEPWYERSPHGENARHTPDEVIDDRVGERARGRLLEVVARTRLERFELKAAIADGSGPQQDGACPHWRDTESAREWVRTSHRGELTAEDVPAR